MEIEDILLDTLRSYGNPVFLQGSLSPDEQYPEKFFTYWNNDSESGAHYSNDYHAIIYDYDVNYYSTDGTDVYATLRATINKLRSHGFITSGDGYSVMSDEPTHCGRGVRVFYRKNL